MNNTELYAADSDGNYVKVHSMEDVERKRYKITALDEFEITSSSLFFLGAYEDALKAWTESSTNGFIYTPKKDKS